MAIWLSSDYHFNHDRKFIYYARGFDAVWEMNLAIVEKHNELIKPDDELYILGDIMLGGDTIDNSLELLREIPGKKTIIAGNHDTDRRRRAYIERLNIPVYDALSLRHRGYHFYLSHYPTLTANLEKESLKQCTLNLFGHTHQTTNFYNDIPMMYHVGVDSHNCYPVNIDTIIEEMHAKVNECVSQL